MGKASYYASFHPCVKLGKPTAFRGSFRELEGVVGKDQCWTGAQSNRTQGLWSAGLGWAISDLMSGGGQLGACVIHGPAQTEPSSVHRGT